MESSSNQMKPSASLITSAGTWAASLRSANRNTGSFALRAAQLLPPLFGALTLMTEGQTLLSFIDTCHT